MAPLVLAGLLALPAAPPPAPAKPNVLLILADDLGFSDLGCYGGEIATPNLDALAKDGLRFTQFYNTARCWPSRAAALSGYYAQQVRRDTVPGVRSGSQGTRPAWAKLLPELLRPLGYRSYHSGKWHVDGTPLAAGFDHSYSLDDHNRYFAPRQHAEDGRALPPADAAAGYYATTAIADHAVKCLKEHAEKYADRPFFEFLAFTAPHFPLQAPAADVAPYRKPYLRGWDALRGERWDRMKSFGIGGTVLAPIERDLGPPYAFPEAMKKLGPNELNRPLPWAELTPAQRDFQAGKMAVHAAMVARMDREIGRVLAQLRAAGTLENTLVLFLSDNGASAEIMVRGDGHDPHAECGTGATFLSLGPGWSSLANTPFRRHKTWVHEGGISTPLIAHWPRGIAARGELRHAPGHLIDLVPTLLELAGGRADAVPPRPGTSLVPLFARDGTVPRESLWWLHEGNRALRAGDWKIVAAGKDSAWELYDLSRDRSETRDQAATRPEKVRELAALWERQAAAYFAQARKDTQPNPERERRGGTLGVPPPSLTFRVRPSRLTAAPVVATMAPPPATFSRDCRMTRPVLLALPLLLGLAAAAPAADPPKPPPNIVVVFCDDHAYQAISAYGDPRKLLDTPNIDRLAKTGVRFDRCLVPNSICGPSRASLLTGKYSHANGFFNNTNNTFDGSQVTFPKLLQKAGYQTAVIGKWHLMSAPTGFDHWHILPGQGVYYNPPMTRDGKAVKHTGYTTDLITDFSLDWLKARDKTKPFLLMTQHKAPHREWCPAARHLGHDHDRKYPEPPTLFDDYAGRGPAEHRQDMTIEKTMTPRDLKLVPPPGLTPEQRKAWDAYYEPRNAAFRAAKPTGRDLVRWKYNRYLHDYLGCVKAVDESVGRILDYLDAEKLADNTVVVYASDQGFYLGEHGWFDKRWVFEESVRTPMLVRWPGVAKPAAANGDLVSLLDLAPTFLEAAGVPVPAGVHGKSLVPVLKGATPADWRKSFYYHYYEYPGPHAVRRHYAVVTDRYKLVRFYEEPGAYWELFDLKTDPKELTSVYGKPEYAAVQKELTAELARLRAELKVPDPDPPTAAIPGAKKK